MGKIRDVLTSNYAMGITFSLFVLLSLLSLFYAASVQRDINVYATECNAYWINQIEKVCDLSAYDLPGTQDDPTFFNFTQKPQKTVDISPFS